MPNPIADPLVEGRDTNDESSFVVIDATPEGLATVAINRPAQHNALNAEVIGALKSAFDTLEGADGVRVALITGVGEAFSSGPDLQWLRDSGDYTTSELHEDAMALGAMLQRLYDLPMLTVCVVHGAAHGVGLGLVAACDFVIATEDASFASPEARLGLVPAVIAPFVVQAIGAKRARALFATGRSFNAAYARDIGLVDEITSDLSATLERVGEMSADAAPAAAAEAKRAVAHAAGREIDHGLVEEMARRSVRARLSEEAREGVAALLAGRAPPWQAP